MRPGCEATPEQLLDTLLSRCWRGDVTLAKAARMVGVRKEDFAELATGKHFLAIIENAAWRYYMAQFNYSFPECDPRARKRDPLFNNGFGERQFTDSDLLKTAHDREWMEGLTGPENEPVPVK